ERGGVRQAAGQRVEQHLLGRVRLQARVFLEVGDAAAERTDLVDAAQGVAARRGLAGEGEGGRVGRQRRETEQGGEQRAQRRLAQRFDRDGHRGDPHSNGRHARQGG